MIDFNSSPYFDDFSENNKFYRILFRPQVAVQARELNQFQSILQNQIKQHGDHVFKEGAVVIPGEFAINTNTDYIKITSYSGTTSVSDLIGTTIQDDSISSASYGLQAVVVHAEEISGSDPVTLYVSYISSADTSTTKTFTTSATLNTVTGASYSVVTAASNPTGKGTIATVQRGVYYVKGQFVLCDKQTIVIDRYNISFDADLLSTRVGFDVNEEIITHDSPGYDSLLDNSQGTPNYGAPGAHRYYIDLILTTSPINNTDVAFVELGRLNGSSVVFLKDKTDYSILDKTLARRTFDESGNYTVSGFDIDVREHRNNNRGSWSSSNAYIIGDVVSNSGNTYVATAAISAGGSAPVHTTSIVNNWQYNAFPYYNRGIYTADPLLATPSDTSLGNANKLAVGFSPGKAYVEGFEIEKISTEYVTVNKPRDTAFVNNASISTAVGNYVLVNNITSSSFTGIHKLPDISTCPIVTLYDTIVTSAGTLAGSAVGTCRIRGVQAESSATVRLYLFDVKMTSGYDFSRNVKSMYYQVGGSPSSTNDFTANLITDIYSAQLSGTITSASASTAVVGVGTRFTTELKVGDYISFSGLTNSNPVKIASITDNNNLVLSANAGVTSTNVLAFRQQTSIIEPTNTSLVFPLPHYATSVVADHIYWVIQQLSAGTVSTNTLTLSPPAGGYFEIDSAQFYVQDASGVSQTIQSSVITTSSAALTFATPPTTSWIVWATVKKTGTTGRRTKTLSTPTSQTFTIASGAAYNNTLTLANVDCYKIISVISGGTDITSWYAFNDGQKDSYYDYSYLTLNPSYPTPTADVVVTYQYFTHTAGDFFDVGSYTGMYDYIPYFNGTNLRDTIDFRPDINSMSLRIPKRGYNMSVDLTYYLARKDKIAISNIGSIFDISGSSSLNPGYPDDPSAGMVLCSLDLAPYTFGTNDVNTTKMDNKRYTMRDIGKLENRINNIEYYTSLSLLEQETSSLAITDSNGLNRFKNGFIVDNFSGHNIGDVTHQDYLCSVDMEHNELRSFSSFDNINLVPDITLSTNHKLYGDVITLPLNTTTPHVALASNPHASRTEFVNPFAVFTFIGDVKMNPASDDWFETERRPDIIQNVDGNFNTISTLAQKSGTLGTVWNSWQTQWVGAPAVTGTSMKAVGGFSTTDYGLGAGFWNSRYNFNQAELEFLGGNATSYGQSAVGQRVLTYQTTAQQIGQSRTGIKTSVVAKIDTKTIDDKVISTAVIPYIRSRNVLVKIHGLKPNTRFYPYFDNIDVSSYCTPAKVLTYTPISGQYDTNTNVGDIAPTDIARRIGGDSQVCLNVGDKITGSSSGATAIVVGTDIYTNPSSGAKTYYLYVVNTIGTFTTSDTMTGSVSSATGTFLSITTPSTIVSSQSGQVNLLFNIPNTNSIRFRTGSREFKLIDNTSATGAFTSRGRTTYNASGILQTKQATVVATRNAEIVQEAVTDNQVLVQSSTRLVRDTGWYDPLAQTFLIDSAGGAFLSKVDLYFAAKDNNIPVTVEIREVVNGYPGKTVLPFSRVTLNPNQIVLSSNTVIDADGVSWPSYDTPTTITFNTPIYVQDATEYALVVMSDSNAYKIWISNLGDRIPGTTNTISEQPYAGVLFKSQNASTWTADQMQDMKFTIWRANFRTDVVGNVVLSNDKVSKYPLQQDPFQTLSGTKYVRVTHNNHSFKVGDSVTIDSAPSTVNGVTVNGTFAISTPTLDSYVILTTGANATATGVAGGLGAYASRNIKFEVGQPNINSLSFPETTASYQIYSTDWSSPTTNYTESCILNDNNYFNTVRVVNGASKSLRILGTFTTSNPALSPIIDTGRSSFIAISNKIDSPTESSINNSNVDQSTLFSGATVTITATTIAASLSANQLLMKQIIPGSYVAITSTTPNNTLVKCLVTAVDSSTGTLTVIPSTTLTTGTSTSASLYYYTAFFDEITPVGSSSTSKYVSKEVKLANQSNTLRIRFAACVPTEADVLVYYKTGIGNADFSKTIWTLLPPDKTLPKSTLGSNTFYDVDYTATNLTLFDKVSVKLVMKSTNTVASPRIKDLRIIACI